MKNKHFVFLCIFFLFVNFYAQSQGSGRQDNFNALNSILTERHGYDFFDRTVQEERKNRYELSKKHFFEAARLYERNVLRGAISEFERAIQQCPHEVYYYYYGVCLMEINDYRNAERAFKKALQFIDYWSPVYEPLERGASPLYSLDQNGAPREKYYTFYQLACIHSSMNNINTSFNYLKEALEYGFPYFDQIFTDPDLKNMLNNYKDVANIIQRIYNAGFVNNLSEKSFEYGRAGELNVYTFLDNRNVYVRSAKDYDNARNGTYEIRNYQIIINYNREEQEIINIKDLSKTWNGSYFDQKP